MIIEIKRVKEHWIVEVNGKFEQSVDTLREAEEDIQELIKENPNAEVRIIK